MNERPSDRQPSGRDPTADGTPATPPRRPAGGASVVLAARGLVAFELAQWPNGDGKELDLAVERLAMQGRHFGQSVEAMIVELKQLVARHAEQRFAEWECRKMREHLVSVLIEAYYRGSAPPAP
jgi:hypothetical protein